MKKGKLVYILIKIKSHKNDLKRLSISGNEYWFFLDSSLDGLIFATI